MSCATAAHEYARSAIQISSFANTCATIFVVDVACSGSRAYGFARHLTRRITAAYNDTAIKELTRHVAQGGDMRIERSKRGFIVMAVVAMTIVVLAIAQAWLDRGADAQTRMVQ